MAEKTISLQRHDRILGEIIFYESPASLELSKTAYGLNLTIPAAVVLRWNDREQPCPLFTNLRAVISVETKTGEKIELGRVNDDSIYSGTTSGGKDHPQAAELLWINVLPALVFVQHNRPNGSPRLDLWVRGELYYLANVVAATPPNVITTQEAVSSVLSYPTKILQSISLTYPKSVWDKLIQAAF